MWESGTTLLSPPHILGQVWVDAAQRVQADGSVMGHPLPHTARTFARWLSEVSDTRQPWRHICGGAVSVWRGTCRHGGASNGAIFFRSLSSCGGVGPPHPSNHALSISRNTILVWDGICIGSQRSWHCRRGGMGCLPCAPVSGAGKCGAAVCGAAR